jgi:transcriptional regulator of NAD metabolism
MPRRDVKTEREIREAIVDYVERYGATSTRTIADYVHSQLGERPANETVATVLKELGYKPLASYWVKS